MVRYILTVGFVLKNRQYALISIISVFSFIALYWFVTMPLFLQHIGTVFTANPLLVVSRVGIIIAIAIVGGINIALVVFRLRNKTRATCCSGMKKFGGGVFGGALSAFTPGCPACTSLLSVALGTVGGLAVLPFGGFELGIISLCAVTFSMFWLSRDIYKTVKISA
ncbi:MAG: putative membrane protein [Cenarchaeum symbiont of Oopsacas minuta]|nr:putative membrane protein [Cenarchaeum symbiont of Oopsacas minuta]